MIVERTFNKEEIKSVITHPDIWGRLIDDYSPSPEYWAPNMSSIVLAGRVPELIGLCVFTKLSEITYRIHFQVLPEYREEYAISFAHGSINWLKENTAARKIVAETPEFHPNVIGFSRKVGFIEEGINSKSFQKDGKLYDQIYLGLKL